MTVVMASSRADVDTLVRHIARDGPYATICSIYICRPSCSSSRCMKPRASATHCLLAMHKQGHTRCAKRLRKSVYLMESLHMYCCMLACPEFASMHEVGLASVHRPSCRKRQTARVHCSDPCSATDSVLAETWLRVRPELLSLRQAAALADCLMSGHGHS